jgi:histidinol-phosphate aminotransferase
MSFIRSDLQGLPTYERPRGEAQGQALGRLHLNEASEGWPVGARRALLDRLERMPFNCYPERQLELTDRLTAMLGAPAGGVLLGPSSGALLDLLVLACLEPGDAVAIPEPGFSLYPALTARHRARLLRVEAGDGFPLEPWLAVLEREQPRQLWLTLPNNPTGAWVSPEALRPLLDAAAQNPNPPLVVLDEAYAEFAPLTHRLAVDRYPNVVLLRTYSKALASAGWRLGYLVGDPALIQALATLQLPYSIPAPALEALDVALDFQGAFGAQAREITARRDRLALALGERAAPSCGNFLLVRPDPGPALKAAGLQTRALDALGAGRITVGTEEEVRRTALALGATLEPPQPRAKRRLLVLDMDGVLLDGEPGFMKAVALALKELAPGLDWQDAHYHAFKRLPGYNNDFRVCAAALALAEEGGLDLLWSKLPADLEERIQARFALCSEAVQRHYLELPNEDVPLVTQAELAALSWNQAVLTGRNPNELELGWKVMGFSLPGVADAAPHLCKPNLGGLLQLADAFRAEEIVFAGDSRDDAQALRGAREARPDLVWRFAAVGPQRDFIATKDDLRVPTLRNLLTILQGARS